MRSRLAAVGRSGWLPWCAFGVLALPLVVAALRLLGARHGPLNSDVALIELRTLDVGTAHHPLTGSYQRFGFNMPGPWLLYTLAPVYRLAGTDYAALQVAALAVGAAAIAGIVAVAWRRGGASLLLVVTATLAVFVQGAGTDRIASPWEPHVVVLPLVLLVFVVWDVCLGNDAALAWMVLLTGWLAMAYLSVAAVAGLLGVVGVGAVAVRAVRARRGGQDSWVPRRPLVVSAAVAVVLLAPPLWEQFRSDPGNITLIWRFLTSGEPPLGVADGWRALSFTLDGPALWAGRTPPLQAFVPVIDLARHPVVPTGLLVLLVGAGGALRWGDRRSRALVGLAAVAVLAFWFAFSRVTGELFSWIVLPAAALGIVTWVAGMWGLWSALAAPLRARIPAVPGALFALFGVGAAVASGWAVRDAVRYEPREARVSVAARALAADALGVIRPDDVALVRTSAGTQSLFAGNEGAGRSEMVLALVHAGVDAVVDAGDGYRFGGDRAQPERANLELELVDAPDGYRPPAGWGLVAVEPLLSPAEQRLRVELEQRLAGVDTLVELRKRIAADPELADLVDRARGIDDLPPIGLIARRVG